MANLPKIRTPLKQHWRRVRYQFLPLFVFGVAVVTTSMLWRDHVATSNVVGTVTASQTDVTALIAGRIISPAIEVFSKVKKGQTIARLDDTLLKAQLDTLRKELVQQTSLIHQKTEEVRLEIKQGGNDAFDHQWEMIVEIRRRELLVEQTNLGILDRQTLIDADTIAAKLLQTRLQRMLAANKTHPGTFATSIVQETHLEREEIVARVRGNYAAIRVARENVAQNQRRLADLGKVQIPAAVTADLDKLIRPLQDAVEVQQARVVEVQKQIAATTIRAPFGGMISAVHAYVGQAVQPGDPIVSLAAEKGAYIVAYLRQRQRIRPVAGDEVEVRPRLIPVEAHVATVIEVGAQYEQVPMHHLRDPQFPEWGLPVKIALPRGTSHVLHPGELVDLTFSATRPDGAALVITATIMP
jgi:multidrug resistance efflux pump